MTWREEAAPIIRRVIHNAKAMGKGEAYIKKALHDAYPFGQRKYYPYKVWLDECKKQLHPELVNHYRQRRKSEPVPKEQMELF